MQFAEIKKLIKEECKLHGIGFYHGRGKTVKYTDNIQSNGYFSPGDENEGPILAVATNANSLDTLIHEYCHMQQHIEGTDVWHNLDDKSQIWEWVVGTDGFTEDELDQSTLASYAVELDCERRSVRQHKIWKTGINITEYIQKANAYTMFYFFMRDNRVWYTPGKEPYALKKVWSVMPKSFTFNRQKWYNKHHEIFKHCI